MPIRAQTHNGRARTRWYVLTKCGVCSEHGRGRCAKARAGACEQKGEVRLPLRSEGSCGPKGGSWRRPGPQTAAAAHRSLPATAPTAPPLAGLQAHLACPGLEGGRVPQLGQHLRMQLADADGGEASVLQGAGEWARARGATGGTCRMPACGIGCWWCKHARTTNNTWGMRASPHGALCTHVRHAGLPAYPCMHFRRTAVSDGFSCTACKGMQHSARTSSTAMASLQKKSNR